MLELLLKVLPPLSEPECDDVAARFERLALPVVDLLVFLDAFA